MELIGDFMNRMREEIAREEIQYDWMRESEMEGVTEETNGLKNLLLVSWVEVKHADV